MMLTLIAATLLQAASVTPAQPAPTPPAPPPPPHAFPASWRGHWKGESVAAAPGREGMTFGTELVIRPTDDPGKWTWTIIYDGKAGRQERKYHLVAADADSPRTGRWKIDENNGIVLDAAYVSDALYCRFQVQGSDISVSYRIGGAGDTQRLVMELVTTPGAGTQTGGKAPVPPVETFGVQSVQRAEMRRVEEAGSAKP